MATPILNHKNSGSENRVAHGATLSDADITRAISELANCRNALTVWIAAANSEDQYARTDASSKRLRLAARAIGQSLQSIHVGGDDREELLLDARVLMEMVELALNNFEFGSTPAPLDNELVSVAQLAAENLEMLANLLATADFADARFRRFLHAVGFPQSSDGVGA